MEIKQEEKYEEKSIVGSLINFRGLVYAPVEENGVVFMFSKITKDLGMNIETIRKGFPDCIAKRFIGGGQWEEVNIEFEFRSSDFVRHHHLDKMHKENTKCDMIVCWEHDWKECPKEIEVLELQSEYKKYRDEEVEMIEFPKKNKQENYNEEYHLKYTNPEMISIYKKIKQSIPEFDTNIQINPQKYYISLREKRNFAYIYFKKKKIWITIMLPGKIINGLVKKHKIVEEGAGVQKFYGGPCFSVLIENEDNLNEILKALEEAYKEQKE